MTTSPTPDRVTALYDAIDAFQRKHRTAGGLGHAQIRALLAEHLDAALPATTDQPAEFELRGDTEIRAVAFREVEQHVRQLARATFQPYYRSAYATLADDISRMADETQPAETAAVDLPTLAAALDGLHTLIATSSRDWGTYRVDAWIWAVLCGWDCEKTEHDGTCTHGALEETAAMHGWDEATVAKARRYRAAVRALTEPAAETHACDSCEGVDPDTCFNNPHRPPEQCPRSEADGYGLQCQKPAGHNLCTFEQPAAGARQDGAQR
ncbi:hypothetical protein ACFZA9_12060 [Streptomyces olivaceus]|uniref:hypothetical protein n=1 Tax=Streptomyces olivaceus TaxID=47716 RepID=UPI0036E8FB47